jgi:hypothetical protein
VSEVDPRWYDGFFEAGWLDYVQPDEELTLRQVDFIVEELALARSSLHVRPRTGRG